MYWLSILRPLMSDTSFLSKNFAALSFRRWSADASSEIVTQSGATHGQSLRASVASLLANRCFCSDKPRKQGQNVREVRKSLENKAFPPARPAIFLGSPGVFRF
jgi:hypothetical protein